MKMPKDTNNYKRKKNKDNNKQDNEFELEIEKEPIQQQQHLLVDENAISNHKEEEEEELEEEAASPEAGVVEESDSSEDEVAPRNTIGDVPLEWYKDEPHIGYDMTGKKIIKQPKKDMLESLLATADDSKNWRKILDELNDEEVELAKQEIGLIQNLLRGKTPHPEMDPYAPYVDWFEWKDAIHPLSSAQEPKRRFIPSKWETKKVVKLIRAIREGRIKQDKPKEEPQLYLLWGDDSNLTEKSGHGLSYIPAPKPKVPGHEESYNPSVEYIPTQEEIDSYQLMYEEDRPKFIPKRFESLRSVPAYENALKESFERCLDLYLCPRARKKRINIDPESLKPKLPNKKDLKPYPSTCFLEYKGHMGAVMSISVEVSGQWLASGSTDGTVRVWEVETGRCLRIWDVGEAVHYVAWNPVQERKIVAVALGHDVLLLNTGLGDEEEQQKVKELIIIEASQNLDKSGAASTVSWLQYDRYEGIRLKHPKAVSKVEWHFGGNYFSTVMPSISRSGGGQSSLACMPNIENLDNGPLLVKRVLSYKSNPLLVYIRDSRAILLHQLSKKHTQTIPSKVRGLPVSSVFHPSRNTIFIATKKSIRQYDLQKKCKLVRKLEPGVREISSIAIHPAGDNVIVGSHEGKLCWFDMDLSSQPYRKLKCHKKDITDVAFHSVYPLFASCSDDCIAYVFHGKVYSDLNQNPLIVPLEKLHGHTSTNGRGVMDCTFHPRQPWLFTAGADSVIKLYCH